MKKQSAGIVSLLFALLFAASALTSCASVRERRAKKQTEQKALPTIEIETEDGQAIADREHDLRMTLTLKDGTESAQTLSGKIRGRGNSTWDFCDKKSYRVMLDTAVDLLGVGKGGEKNWILLANAREKSMLRNYAMFALAEKIGVYPVCKSIFVSVTLNGEYIGLYQLCEAPEASKNRLDVETHHSGEDIGFLLELDKRARADSKSRLDYFYVNDWEIPFAVKSEIRTEAQNAYIKDYVERVDDAILEGNLEKIEELVDIPSLVDLYLIEEFSKDRDVGFSSFYLYKKEGEKLCFGYPWDFDLALGNDTGEDRMAEENSPDIDYPIPEGVAAALLNRWYAALDGCPWFVAAAAARWAEIAPLVDATVCEIKELGYSMISEAERNYRRWKIMGKKQLFEPTKIVVRTTYVGQIDYLCDWMTERRQWLDGYFIGRTEAGV